MPARALPRVRTRGTDDALYVWERPWYPQYYVLPSGVSEGVLVPSGTPERPGPLGVARFFHVVAGDVVRHDAAWTYRDAPVAARVRFEWDAMDAWFEEDEEVFVHPRDPGVRVQTLASSRRVVVTVDGVVVADSVRPVFLYETRLVRRTYLPKLDVRMELLVPSETVTRCPYKGTARYWHVVTPAGCQEDLAWSYPTPLREAAAIAGMVAFYDERARVQVAPVPPLSAGPLPGTAAR
jgi:uncharacterized protein (DUF427 family)